MTLSGSTYVRLFAYLFVYLDGWMDAYWWECMHVCVCLFDLSQLHICIFIVFSFIFAGACDPFQVYCDMASGGKLGYYMYHDFLIVHWVSR